MSTLQIFIIIALSIFIEMLIRVCLFFIIKSTRLKSLTCKKG